MDNSIIQGIVNQNDIVKIERTDTAVNVYVKKSLKELGLEKIALTEATGLKRPLRFIPPMHG